MESMRQMGEMARGERRPSREFHIGGDFCWPGKECRIATIFDL